MTALTVTSITTADALEALLPDWCALFHTSRAPNPFANPLWLKAWAHHFIKPEQLYLLTARDADGTLVAVAPFYKLRRSVGPLHITSIQLLGTGRHADLTELPQVLVAPGQERAALRAIMHYLGSCADEWDWVEVTLTPEQGWFEPQWLPKDGPGQGSFVLHKLTRPCVVLSLPPTWEELRAGLKRNLKESLRHGTNSLKRDGYMAKFVVPDSPDGVRAVLHDLITLHQARSTIQGKVRHSNHFDGAAARAFLYDVGQQMFQAGHMTPHLMCIDGAPAAARLLLHANGCTFFSCSGFAPRWWPYGVATTLMAESLRHAIARGDHMVNLSPGPDVAKLRWSETLQLHQEFLMAGPRRSSRLAFALFWQLRAAELINRERHRHEEK